MDDTDVVHSFTQSVKHETRDDSNVLVVFPVYPVAVRNKQGGIRLHKIFLNIKRLSLQILFSFRQKIDYLVSKRSYFKLVSDLLYWYRVLSNPSLGFKFVF